MPSLPHTRRPAAGEIITIAGWVTKPGVAPVWIRKSLAVVRGSQELRGTGTLFTAVGGFGQPIDTAFDASTPSVVYVADNGRHCIWRVTIGATGANGVPTAEVSAGGGQVCDETECRGPGSCSSDMSYRQHVLLPMMVSRTPHAAHPPQVTLLAGSSDGTSGYQDGPGTTARFNKPFSLSWAMFAGTPSLYISDSANHAVRRVNLTSGVVSTVWGGPSTVNALTAAGVGLFDRVSAPTWEEGSGFGARRGLLLRGWWRVAAPDAALLLQTALRTRISATVTAAAAASGTRPTIYWPAALRTDSNGEGDSLGCLYALTLASAMACSGAAPARFHHPQPGPSRALTLAQRKRHPARAWLCLHPPPRPPDQQRHGHHAS